MRPVTVVRMEHRTPRRGYPHQFGGRVGISTTYALPVQLGNGYQKDENGRKSNASYRQVQIGQLGRKGRGRRHSAETHDVKNETSD